MPVAADHGRQDAADGGAVVGETWPQIMAFGAIFGDARNPQPVFRVGNPGDVGDVEISDMMFTMQKSNPGSVLV